MYFFQNTNAEYMHFTQIPHIFIYIYTYMYSIHFFHTFYIFYLFYTCEFYSEIL